MTGRLPVDPLAVSFSFRRDARAPGGMNDFFDRRKTPRYSVGRRSLEIFKEIDFDAQVCWSGIRSGGCHAPSVIEVLPSNAIAERARILECIPAPQLLNQS